MRGEACSPGVTQADTDPSRPSSSVMGSNRKPAGDSRMLLIFLMLELELTLDYPNQTVAGRCVSHSFPALTPPPTTFNPLQNSDNPISQMLLNLPHFHVVPCPYSEANDFLSHCCNSHLTEVLDSGFSLLSIHTAFGENFPEYAYKPAAAFRIKSEFLSRAFKAFVNLPSLTSPG